MQRLLIHKFTLQKGRVKYPLIGVFAFVLAACPIFGLPSPFPLSLVGSVSGFGAIAAFLGAAAGYFISGSFVDGIPLIAAIAALGALRLLFPCGASRLIRYCTAGAVTLCAAFCLSLPAIMPSGLLTAAALGAAAGALTLSFSAVGRIMGEELSLTLIKPQAVAGVCAVLCVLSLSLSAFSISIFNLGIVASALLSLVFGKRYRYGGGAMVGVVMGIGAVIYSDELALSALCLAAAAMLSALFTRFGRITQAAAFVLSSAVLTFAVGADSFTLNGMACCFAAALVYILIPFELITARIRKTPEPGGGAQLSEIFAERLRITGSTLGEMKRAVERTAEVLDRQNNREIAWVYTGAADAVCRKCRHSMTCWGEEYGDTTEQLNDLMKRFRKGHIATVDDLPRMIRTRCPKREQLAFSLNSCYREYLSSGAAARKIAEMRSILTAQLSATEKMLEKMSDEFESCDAFDRRSAARIESILTAEGLKKPRAAVFLNGGRMAVEAYGEGALMCNAEGLCERVREALRRDFDLPDVSTLGKAVRITMYERATFCAEYGACQINRRAEAACGDYYDSFVDGHGFAYIILSDGMGSGSRARIDSAFACSMLIKLLRANVALEAAMELINTSLLVKSSDESFATLDICRIDLYSGHVELFKAGSAATFIRSGRHVFKADARGVPVGIGRRADMPVQTFSVDSGDMIILASDGTAVNETWLEQEIVRDSGNDLNELARRIAEQARFGAEKGKDDDISVVAVRIVR